MKQTLAEMLSQLSMLGKLWMLFYRGLGLGGLAVLVVGVGRVIWYQTEAIYGNDGEEQSSFHQNTFSELQTRKSSNHMAVHI